MYTFDGRRLICYSGWVQQSSSLKLNVSSLLSLLFVTPNNSGLANLSIDNIKFIDFIYSGCHGIETIESEVAEWKAKLESRNCELITKSQVATHSQVLLFSCSLGNCD